MEKQATSIRPLTQGEKLLLLVFRARKRKISTKKVALGLGYHPEYLPYLYKQPTLTMELIKAASDYFNVHPSIFDDDPSDGASAELLDELRIIRAELNETRRELAESKARIKTLEEDRIIRQAREIEKQRRRSKPDDTPNHN